MLPYKMATDFSHVIIFIVPHKLVYSSTVHTFDYSYHIQDMQQVK